jgi:hypothetical protein
MWKRHDAPAVSRDRSLSATAGAVLAIVALTGTLALAGCGSDSPAEPDPGPDPVPLADPPPDASTALATITEADLAARVGVVAHDSTLGRSTPSPELQKAALYIAGEFDRLGLEGDDPDTDVCTDRGVPGEYCPYLQWFTAQPADTAPTLNVIARLAGSDPAVSDEHVLIGAHFDHVGIGIAVAADSIYNGADDNGSGVAAVLELAEAFVALDTPPRRSIIFVLFSGEELGLLGSRYYTLHSTVPMSDVVTMVNLDMIGRNWTNMVAGISQLDSDIFDRSDRVADAHPELDMDLIADPWPEENHLNRSDQAPFVLHGVPVLYLTSGLHADYHQPSDEADRLDYEKTTRVTKLVFWLLWEFAQTTEPPGFIQ